MPSDNTLETTATTQCCQPQSIPSLSNIPGSDEYDFLIIGDGSGYLDHLGGFGAVTISSKHPKLTYERSFGCSTHAETGRAEFMALLTAMHAIIETCDLEHSSKLELLEARKPVIYLLSDRMDLVGSILKLYRRKTNRDLWAMFEWYEKYFTIKAAHIPRDTFDIHKAVDAIASEMRMVLLDFHKTQVSVENI